MEIVQAAIAWAVPAGLFLWGLGATLEWGVEFLTHSDHGVPPWRWHPVDFWLGTPALIFGAVGMGLLT